MALFDFLRPKAETPQPKVFKRSYQAASTGRLFDDFKGSNLSADAELKSSLAKMRNRSRDLARNNEYAKRYFDLAQTNVVGDQGFKLQVKATDNGILDTRGNDAIEIAWKMWTTKGNCTTDGRLSFLDCQKLAVESLLRDGEVFAIMHFSKDFTHNFAIQFVEPDLVDETLNETAANGNKIRMGVELNKYNRPVAYYFRKTHPGDNDTVYYSIEKKYTRIPAERVLHVYDQSRVGLTRGEPRLAPVITVLKQLDGLREAQLVACRIGASKMGFFTSPAGDGFMADDYDQSVPLMDVEPGTLHQLPTGVNFEEFNPGYPTEFESFHKAILKGVASGMGISYNSLSNDLEATSYSSIRQGALEERDHYKGLQTFMIDHFVKPIYQVWLRQAMDFGGIFLPSAKYDKFFTASQFRARGWNWVDPQKEMTAAITGLKNGVLSLQDVASQYGKDVEELLSQIQRDKALAEQFGVQYALEPYGAVFTPVSPDGTVPPDNGGSA